MALKITIEGDTLPVMTVASDALRAALGRVGFTVSTKRDGLFTGGAVGHVGRPAIVEMVTSKQIPPNYFHLGSEAET